MPAPLSKCFAEPNCPSPASFLSATACAQLRIATQPSRCQSGPWRPRASVIARNDFLDDLQEMALLSAQAYSSSLHLARYPRRQERCPRPLTLPSFCRLHHTRDMRRHSTNPLGGPTAAEAGFLIRTTQLEREIRAGLRPIRTELDFFTKPGRSATRPWQLRLGRETSKPAG